MFEFGNSYSEVELIPEEFRSLYAKADGSDSFTINKTLSERLDNSKLTGALDKERKNAKGFKSLLEQYTAISGSPEELGTTLQELQAQVSSSADGKVDFDKWKADFTRTTSMTVDAKDKELSAMENSLKAFMIDGAGAMALSEYKGSAKLLMPHIHNVAHVVKTPDGGYAVQIKDSDGDSRADGNGGFMDIAGLVKEMSTSDDFSMAFQGKEVKGMESKQGQRGPVSAGGDKRSGVDKIAAGLANRR